jgi:hypothetical protein
MGDLRQLEGRQIEIKGTIQDYDGRAEIVLRRTQQLGDGAFLVFPPVPTDYDVERQGHNSAGNPPAKKAKKTTTNQGNPGSIEDPSEPQQRPLLPANSHHPLTQFVQRILCTTPNNAAVRERINHRPQQRVHEEAGAYRMEKKVIGWTRRPHRHPIIDREHRQ